METILKLNFGPSQTELQDSNALEVERIYVVREYYGKRIHASSASTRKTLSRSSTGTTSG